eukprot:1527800-Rhodomonas_salina.1
MAAKPSLASGSIDIMHSLVASHHACGDCSALPSEGTALRTSCDAVHTTSPARVITAALTALVPTSMERICDMSFGHLRVLGF